MSHPLSKPFCVSRELAQKHPQLTAKDLISIKEIKESGNHESWDSVFEVFLASIGIGSETSESK